MSLVYRKALVLNFVPQYAVAQIVPEEVSVETMQKNSSFNITGNTSTTEFFCSLCRQPPNKLSTLLQQLPSSNG